MDLGEIGVAHDPGQDIVEVMGDPTGENAQAFEFLGVEETTLHFQLLLLGTFAVGDVLHHTQAESDLPVRATGRSGCRLSQEGLAVFPKITFLH